MHFYSLVYTNFCSFVSIFEGKPRIYTALAVKYSSKLDIFARLLVYLQNKLIILLIMSVNKVILIGNVGKDPEVRHLDRNMAVANIVLATTERGYTLQNGTQVPDRTSGTMWCCGEAWPMLWRDMSARATSCISKAR